MGTRNRLAAARKLRRQEHVEIEVEPPQTVDRQIPEEIVSLNRKAERIEDVPVLWKLPALGQSVHQGGEAKYFIEISLQTVVGHPASGFYFLRETASG